MAHENGDKQRLAKRRHVQGMLDETDPLSLQGCKLLGYQNPQPWRLPVSVYPRNQKQLEASKEFQQESVLILAVGYQEIHSQCLVKSLLLD